MVEAIRPTVRLLLPCPPRDRERAWGDYYFGNSLGESLRRAGFSVRFSYAYKGRLKRAWDYLRRVFARNEIEFAIRGKALVKPAIGKRRLLWVISQPDALNLAELASFDHVFVASPTFHNQIAGYCKASSVLHQCTDATRFVPSDLPQSGRALFVGNRRDYAPRPIVQAALDAGCGVEVWGRGWEEIVPDDCYSGIHIENTELPRYYGTASVLLNDHVDDMRREGFVSNRVYDGLACATLVLTEEMPGIPEDLRPHLSLYESFDEAGAKAAVMLTHRDADRDTRLATAEHVRRNHSFDSRITMIAAVITDLFAPALTGPTQDPNAH